MYNNFARYRGLRFNIWLAYQKIFRKDWIKKIKVVKLSNEKKNNTMSFSLSGNKRARKSTETERDYYEKDLIQPFENGKVNKDFIKIYGDDFYKQKGMTDQQINN